MKYKAGDKVKIKTRKRMEEEFGIRADHCISTIFGFVEEMEKSLNKLNSDRNLIIKEVIFDEHAKDDAHSSFYKMEQTGWNWDDGMIECLTKDYIEPYSIPIKSRWEILDL